MRTLARIESGRRSSWAVVVLSILVLGALFALLPAETDDSAPVATAPATAASARVADLLDGFPGADESAAIVVVATDGETAFTAEEGAYLDGLAAGLADLSTVPQAVRAELDEAGTAAVIVVPTAATDESAEIAAEADAIRAAIDDDRPAGVTALLTGPVGFQADILNAFAGADTRLLLITAGVVAALLLITYRSPILWLVPLTVVAVGDGLARFVVSAIAAAFDIPVDASILGILSVLVFGAGTNYALLLIARYREGLLDETDHRRAMLRAVTGAGPAILASGGTVALSLLMLLFASLAGNRALGIACAIGVAIALAMSLLVLPAALVVCGRGLFWPFIPRAGSAQRDRITVWARIGRFVARRPVVVGTGAVVLLAVLATGIAGARIGLSQTEQFVGSPDSVRGSALLADAFGDGYGNTATLLAPSDAADDAAGLAADVPGVTAATPGDTVDGLTRIVVDVDAAPQSEAAFDVVSDLRTAFAEGPAATSATLVGGADATALDIAAASADDRLVVIPLILAVVLLVLLVLLRSIVAPLLLLATVLGTFFASLGAAHVLFRTVLGFPAFDTSVVLYSFLFLVALGIDYNIFLTTRAREERARVGARAGMGEALTRTGGVITSAGILLAAVFVVLGVLPVVALAQIGTIVCIGILLDTLIVRTLLVPALAFLLGEAFWWPSRPADDAVTGSRIGPSDELSTGGRFGV